MSQIHAFGPWIFKWKEVRVVHRPVGSSLNDMVNGFICLRSPYLVFRFINFGSFGNGFRKIFVLPVTCLLVLQTTWINDHCCFSSCCSHARPGTAFVLYIVHKKQWGSWKRQLARVLFWYSFFIFFIRRPPYNYCTCFLDLD